jgi:hypothetical protein
MPLQKKSFLSSIKLAIYTAILATLNIQPTLAYQFDQPIENAFKLGKNDASYGQIKFNLRYRYELADVANNDTETAHANTLRLRFGYLTPEFHGLQAFAEYEGNLAMQRDYQVLTGAWLGDPNRDVIADPQHNEFNQGWLKYNIFNTEFKGGRQRIIVNNARFVGAVGWRQMEQTYDSALMTSHFIENLSLQVGYIGQVQNIFSIDDTVQLPFANASYNIKDFAKISVYGYWLADDDNPLTDSDGNQKLDTKSAQTYGFSIAGSEQLTNIIKLHYHGEYSYQTDYKNPNNSFKLHRYHLMLSATAFNVTAKTAIEELGSNGTHSFQTPLGTNHKFQGWADIFLTTPEKGVRDINALLSTNLLNTQLGFIYHNFKSATSSIDYGNEYDFLITKKFGKHYSILAQYAYYNAQDYKTDTHKFWLQGNISF